MTHTSLTSLNEMRGAQRFKGFQKLDGPEQGRYAKAVPNAEELFDAEGLS